VVQQQRRQYGVAGEEAADHEVQIRHRRLPRVS
jgi:hypothetical protein